MCNRICYLSAHLLGPEVLFQGDTVKNYPRSVRCYATDNWKGFPQPPHLLRLDSLPPQRVSGTGHQGHTHL